MGGRKMYISPEERAFLVALFRDTPSISSVARNSKRSNDLVRRILMEEGVYVPGEMVQGRTAQESKKLKRDILRLWKNGASKLTIRRDLHVGDNVIDRVTKGVERPKGRRFLRRPTSSMTTDPIALSWIAGVIDASAQLGLEHAEGHERPYIRLYCMPDFAQTLARVAGCGRVYDAKEQRRPKAVRYMWQLVATADTLVFMRSIEPYLKSWGPMARRVLLKYESVLAQIDEREEVSA